jgi:hypothetical protein
MQLHSLSYMSSAVHLPTREEIDHLLERSRRFNAQHEVTGVLFYSEGSFHQYLEGPLEGIERVYARVLASRMHHNIFELLREPIEAREFSDWSMGYRAVGVGPSDPVLERLLGNEAHGSSPGRLLLSAYWDKVIGHRVPGAAARAGGADR